MRLQGPCEIPVPFVCGLCWCIFSELKKYYFFINSNYGGEFFSYFFNIFQKQSKVWIKEIGEVEENGRMDVFNLSQRKKNSEQK